MNIVRIKTNVLYILQKSDWLLVKIQKSKSEPKWNTRVKTRISIKLYWRVNYQWIRNAMFFFVVKTWLQNTCSDQSCRMCLMSRKLIIVCKSSPKLVFQSVFSSNVIYSQNFGLKSENFNLFGCHLIFINVLLLITYFTCF